MSERTSQYVQIQFTGTEAEVSAAIAVVVKVAKRQAVYDGHLTETTEGGGDAKP